MRPAPFIALALTTSMCAAGCRGFAVQNVRHEVFRLREQLDSGELASRPAEFAEAERFLSQIAARIRDAARRADPVEPYGGLVDPFDRFDVYVVHAMAPNAFVVGDDFAVVTLPLVLMTERADELAAALAHEMAHNVAGHVIESDVKAQWVKVGRAGLALAGFAADYARYREERRQNRFATFRLQWTTEMWNLATWAGQALLLRFLREQELDADRRAVVYLREAGYDPGAFVRLAQRFRATTGEGGGGDHPSWSERIRFVAPLVSAPSAPGPAAPPRSIEDRRLRSLQRRLALAAVRLDRERRLVPCELEIYGIAATGGMVPRLHACGSGAIAPQAAARLLGNLVALRLQQR